ncbi:MAG: hypothetical protein L6R43_07980 [Planctomycetes bacterium]|nr:hypothetical protein [Planctomycetota bacterium]
MRKGWMAFLAGLLLFAWGATGFRGSWYSEFRQSRCTTCGSLRTEERCRVLGRDGPRAPFTADRDSILPSRVHEDWFAGSPHGHTWTLDFQVDREGYLRSTAHGNAWAPLAISYDRDDGFRRVVLEAVASGALTREEAGILLGFPLNGRVRADGGPPPVPAERILPVLRKALPLLQEASFESRDLVVSRLARE